MAMEVSGYFLFILLRNYSSRSLVTSEASIYPATKQHSTVSWSSRNILTVFLSRSWFVCLSTWVNSYTINVERV